MGINLSTFGPFTEDGDQAIQIQDEPTIVIGAGNLTVMDADDQDLLGGDDVIIAYGEFVESQLTIIPIEQDIIVIGQGSNIIGLDFDSDIDATLELGSGNDTVLGAAQFIALQDTREVGRVYGIDGNGFAISLGADNDILAGLALGSGATATGINDAGIDLGDGTNIVVGVGASAAIGSEVTKGGSASGIEGASIVASSGDSIVAGAGIVSGNQFATLSAVGIGDATFNLDGSAVILGVALGLSTVEEGGEPLLDASNGMVKSRGADLGEVETGGSADIVAGVTAYLSLEDGNFQSNTGLVGSFSGIQTNGGNDIVLGVAAALVAGSGTMSSNKGLNAKVDTGAGNDQVIGVVAGVYGDTVDAAYNFGIDGSRVTLMETGEGEDLVIGLVDIAAANIEGLFGSAGIHQQDISTGDDNDIVIGLSLPSLAVLAGEPEIQDIQSYGLQGTFFNDVVDAAELEEMTIDLGDGDDFVFARGLNGGIDFVALLGQEGDDTFDIHSGYGTVSGGADFDTLILAGNSTDFFKDIGADQQADGDAEYAPFVLTDYDTTSLRVDGIEVFVFDDGAFTYDDLNPAP